MDHPETTAHVSLCAGYGGIDLGLRRVVQNLRTIALCEIEAYAVSNLVAKMEAGLLDPAPIWPDLKTFPWSAFRDRVDILSGGYPCQPFSCAGLRGGGGDPRHLWPYIATGIAVSRPRLCFFENVEGHISLGLSDVLNDLGELGYRTTWGIFSAAEVGAPHQRKRVFILAHPCGERGKRSERFFRDAGAIGQRRQDSQAHSHIDRWPSLPGKPQHNWEPSQTIEPSVGRDAHGTSGTLGQQLRLLGNGVVPATAALAFSTLMQELKTKYK